MPFNTIISSVSETILGIGAMAFAIGQFFGGKTTSKDAGLQAALNTIEALKENISILIEEQKKNHDDIIGLKKDLEYTRAENDRLTKIIENRNPELLEILKEVRDFMKSLNTKQDHQTNLIESQVKKEAIIAERDVNLIPGRTGVN